MHCLGDIGRAEIHDDALRLGDPRNSQVGVLPEGVHRPTHGFRPHPIIHEAGTGHGGFFPAFGGWAFFGQPFGQFPRVQAVSLGGDHSEVGLKVAVALVCTRPNPWFSRQIGEMGHRPGGYAFFQLGPQGHQLA